MSSSRLANQLNRDLFILQNENDPENTEVDVVYPVTTLDQVFDPLSPTNETLREILDGLKEEILTGGKGGIVFPVTSVNGMQGDIRVDKTTVGLGKVDNTRDIDKPLSNPQRESIMEILANYNFQINIDDLWDHIKDGSNPHHVTIEQLNENDALEKFIKAYIGSHNYSTDRSVHIDIRNSLARLWSLVDSINGDIETRVGQITALLDEHLLSDIAHADLLSKKENITDKVSSIKEGDHLHYPDTKAVVDYTKEQLEKFRGTLPGVVDWIDDIQIVENRGALPVPSKAYHRKVYFIRRGTTSFQEIAVCRKYPNGTYDWDISALGSYSKFDPTYFTDSSNGLGINLYTLAGAILERNNGALDRNIYEILKNYYMKEEIDHKGYMTNIKIIPGSVNGTIRYYINNDYTTMSDDINLPGIQRLAYMEHVSENEILEQSIWGKHILDRAIDRRHLNGRIISPDYLTCRHGYILGNVTNAKNSDAHEVSLLSLADMLRPLIGGWPDPNTPGGNPWNEIAESMVMHPHRMDPAIEYTFPDGSCARRFVGVINSIENVDVKTVLSKDITVENYRLLDTGGSWEYQTEPTSEWAMLGSATFTSDAFASVILTEKGLLLDSLSNTRRKAAQYDIWVKYSAKDQMFKFDGTD